MFHFAGCLVASYLREIFWLQLLESSHTLSNTQPLQSNPTINIGYKRLNKITIKFDTELKPTKHIVVKSQLYTNILNSYYQVFSTNNVFDITNLQSMLQPILDVFERLEIIWHLKFQNQSIRHNTIFILLKRYLTFFAFLIFKSTHFVTVKSHQVKLKTIVASWLLPNMH